MKKKNLNNLIFALLITISTMAGQYVHLNRRLVLLLGIAALLAWVVFLSFLLLNKKPDREFNKRIT